MQWVNSNMHFHQLTEECKYSTLLTISCTEYNSLHNSDETIVCSKYKWKRSLLSSDLENITGPTGLYSHQSLVLRIFSQTIKKKLPSNFLSELTVCEDYDSIQQTKLWAAVLMLKCKPLTREPQTVIEVYPFLA